MLTPAQCRKLDPATKNLSDEELEVILCGLYGLGNLALESWFEVKENNLKNPLGVLPGPTVQGRVELKT